MQQQLINPNNWITADIVRLNDLERWTYTSTDVPAVNRYNDFRSCWGKQWLAD
ncbi:MAG: hypothetical protein R3B93_16035 [Bacteroidia bacterium]